MSVRSRLQRVAYHVIPAPADLIFVAQTYLDLFAKDISLKLLFKIYDGIVQNVVLIGNYGEVIGLL